MADKNQMFTRIPFQLNDAFEAGDITAPMLVVMNHLHRHAKWSTGVVRNTSAPFIALAFSSADAWKTDTVKDALRRLEKQGYITRHMTLGSKKPYAITINNYLAVTREPIKDENGKLTRSPDGKPLYNQKISLINPSEIKGYDYSDLAQSPDSPPDSPPDDPPDIPRNTIKDDIHESHDSDDKEVQLSTEAKNSGSESTGKTETESEIESESETKSESKSGFKRLLPECLRDDEDESEDEFESDVELEIEPDEWGDDGVHDICVYRDPSGLFELGYTPDKYIPEEFRFKLDSNALADEFFYEQNPDYLKGDWKTMQDRRDHYYVTCPPEFVSLLKKHGNAKEAWKHRLDNPVLAAMAAAG